MSEQNESDEYPESFYALLATLGEAILNLWEEICKAAVADYETLRRIFLDWRKP